MKLSKKKIRQILARRQMSATQVAERCGKSRQWASSVMSGKKIAPKTAGMIAAALEVDITEILEEE